MRLKLRLSEEKVEEFIVDLLKTGLVRGRMDQVSRKVFITSTMRRTFGTQQWSDLYRVLTSWKALLANVRDTLVSVTQ
jgi:translation initiation factor 3 subunit M